MAAETATLRSGAPVRVRDARELALRVLEAALGPQRLPAEETFQRLASRTRLDARDRAFARRLYATVFRRLGEIDRLIERTCEHPPKRTVRNLLRLGIAQLVHLGTPPHAAVGETVGLTRRLVPAYAGFVNAVLRRIARERPRPLEGEEAGRINAPSWLFAAWSRAWGEDAAVRIAAMHLREPPLDLRPLADPEAWAQRLGGALLPTGVVRLPGTGPVEELPGYAEGAWIVQDVAAGLPALLLDPRPGERVLDLCAAPGGKTVQLAAAGAVVSAVDVSPGRLARLRANLERTGLVERVEVVEADVRSFRPGSPAPRVLLDAPCTATGTIRRHPDIQHTKRPEDVGRMAALQAELLAAAAEMVAPGGVLVYAVCSLHPAEGEERVAALLEARSDFASDPVRPEELRGLPARIDERGSVRTFPFHLEEKGGMDGFFTARLRRRA